MNQVPTQVSPLPKFRSVLENGTVVESMRPFEPIKAPGVKYYHLSVKNASMHRTDGVRLAFINGIHETDILPSQQFLDQEIAYGSPYLTEATEEQVKAYLMFKDPRGTIQNEMRPEVEANVREELMAQIKQQLGLAPDDDIAKLKGTDGVAEKLAGVKLGTTVVKTENATVVLDAPGNAFQRAVVGSDKINAGAADSVGTASAPGTTSTAKGK